MAHLSLSCLGPFQVALDGQPVTDFKSNKVRALLAYLAVEVDRPHRREVLAGLLWPDWPDREALGNLRYALSDLRGVIGDRARAGGRGRARDTGASPPFLLVTRDSLCFNAASDYRLDVAGFLDLVGRGDASSLEEAVALYRGGFLEGFSLDDSAPFEEWALLTRERLDRQMSSALQRLAAAYEQQGAYDRAESAARQQVEREPWDEVAHRQLMRAMALGGQRSAALAQYEACRRLLAEELDVEPAAETTRLQEQIRDGALAAPMPYPVRLPDLSSRPPAFLEGEEPAGVEPPAFVARERELAQLADHLEAALAGQGRVAFVTGDAGSGKTALIEEFARQAQAAHPDLVVAGGQGNAQTGVGDPYLPFREILGLMSGDVEAQWAAGAMTLPQARRLWQVMPRTIEALLRAGPDLIDLLVPGAPLLERAGAMHPWPGEPTSPEQLRNVVSRKADAASIHALQQSALFEQYSQVLRAVAGHKPLLLTVDDLQWADGGSLHLLFHLGRRLAGSRILLLGAYRPAEVALGRRSRGIVAGGEDGEGRERHPLEPVVNEIKRTFGDVEVDLERGEGRPFVEALLDSEPNCLGNAFREALYRRTQGHPLFTVELLRGMQERGDLAQDGQGRWVEGPALDWDTLPARVEAVVAERIGRLPQGLRDLLRIASVEGEMFTAEVAARVQNADEGETVQRLSKTLDRRHRLVSAQGIRRLGMQRLSRYRFRHILFQRYLYGGMDPVERGYLHEQVGTILEALYRDQEARARMAVAPQLAWHFEQAGIIEKAIRYLHQAGERAVQLSAYEEGIAHLTRGLALLPALDDSPGRDRQELDLRLVLGTARMGQGLFAPEVEATYARARELGRAAGETTQLCMALGEMVIFYYVRAEHHRARDLAEEALGLARQAGDPLLAAWCHWHLGFILFATSDFVGARQHLEQVTTTYDPGQHPGVLTHLPGADAGTGALAYQAACLWCLGYPEQALMTGRKAVALARRSGHLMSLADALCFGGCTVHSMRRDAQALMDKAEELVQLGQKAYTWLPPGIWHRGAALVLMGQLEEGMAQLREGMGMHRATDKACSLPPVLAFLAEAQARAGQPEAGLSTLEEAVALMAETDERYWEAEIYRLKGELLRAQGRGTEAEASLQWAIEVARRQEARSWELRATTSLAKLWQAQGRAGEARQALAAIYRWFTEGFDTPDLQEARALLEELA
jgi:DNA-binding SARP family transcriptional activator/predicted ATPase